MADPAQVRWVAWLKAVGAPQYEDVDADPQQLLSHFKRDVIVRTQLNAKPMYLVLRVVKRGAGKPTKAEEDAALVSDSALLDDPSSTLLEAGLSPVSWLLAVTVPAGDTAPAAATLDAHPLDARLNGLERLLERLFSEREPTRHDTTTSALGSKTLALLQRQERLHDHESGAGEPALDAQQLQGLLKCVSETEVVRLLTPTLWRLRVAPEGGAPEDGCSSVLVNSENFVWLDDPVEPLRPDQRMKPDLYVAPRMCVEEHPGTEAQGSGPCYLFGRLADRRLQLDGCVREVYEAKLAQLNMAHLGELVVYHRLIPGECRGMLFNGTQFWLFSSFNGHPERLVRSRWAVPGSADLVRRFFEDNPPPPPPFVAVLRALLSGMRLRLAPQAGSCYLGGGSSGRVFAVQAVDCSEGGETLRRASRRALKVVLASGPLSLLDLTREFEALQYAAAKGGPVVPVVSGSLRLLGGVGGGFLLTHCGAPTDAVTSPAACAAAFASLARLHSCGVFHGDPRLDNLLLLDGKAAWVDLSAGLVGSTPDPKALAALAREDVEVLARSFMCAAGVMDDGLSPSVVAALDLYDCAVSETVAALAAAVWAVFRGK